MNPYQAKAQELIEGYMFDCGEFGLTQRKGNDLVTRIATALLDAENLGLEKAAVAAESVTPRHTECGNKIAGAIRALKGSS